MTSISPSVQLFLNLAKAQAIVSRRFNSGLGGLGFTEFIIMFSLGEARDMKLRRVDLAEKVGLTPSGVTRLLAPMEKVGLIERESNALDARVSYVTLTSAGKRQLAESLLELDRLADDLIPASQSKNVETTSELLTEIVLRAR